MTSKSTETKRQRKTPRQRAEEALGVAERKHTKAVANVDRLTKELQTAKAEESEAKVDVEYLRQAPALREVPFGAGPDGIAGDLHAAYGGAPADAEETLGDVQERVGVDQPPSA